LFGGVAILAGGSVLPTFNTFAIGSGLGAFLGFAALPYFSPDQFKPRPVTCSIVAGVVGVLCALSLGLALTISVLTVLAFAGLGYLAPYWVKKA
jgi:hypothetical protein